MKIENGKRLPTITDEGIYGFFGDYRCFSNFHMCEIEWEGIKYPSSEHAYMAAKTLDQESRLKIASLTNPAAAKKFGRELELRENWDEIKFDIMFDILMYKFIHHKDIRKILLETGDLYLEETNNWGDVIWGVCNGKGTNELGKTLMRVRDILKKA